MSTRFSPLALAAAITLTCLSGAAFAGVPQVASGRSVDVPTSGLDLAIEQDRAKLDQRIALAARRVCTPDDGRDLAAMANRPACEQAAIAAARPQRDEMFARADTRMRLAVARVAAEGRSVN